MNKSAVLKVNNIYKEGILKDISFSIYPGEMVAVMGPSGSGKSTLLHNVSGMDNFDMGSVLLNGKDIAVMNEDEKGSLRLLETGFVFQNMNMLSNLNILDNVKFPAMSERISKDRQRTVEKKAMELLRKFGVDTLAGRQINEVSGGQLQRACIARSMINDPVIIFADEPTGALNQSSSQDVINAFETIRLGGTSILLVTHDSRVAASCDRIMFILDGRIYGEHRMQGTSKKEREENVNMWLSKLEW